MKKLVLLVSCAAVLCAVPACKKESSYSDCILNNIDKLNKSAADDDNEEIQQLVKKLKEKMPLINGVMKVSTLVFHYGLQANKLLLDLVESYIAAVALVCEQSLKSVDE